MNIKLYIDSIYNYHFRMCSLREGWGDTLTNAKYFSHNSSKFIESPDNDTSISAFFAVQSRTHVCDCDV